MFRALNWFMALLFLVAVAVRSRRPGPGAVDGTLRSGMRAVGHCSDERTSPACPRRRRRGCCVCVGARLGEWRLRILSTYAHMFDAWEMKSLPIEEAREASGLFIVLAWMAVPCALPRRSSWR